jgi:hypothetical protein
MYAVIRRYEGVQLVEEVVRRANEGLEPLVSQVPGYVAYWAIDAGHGVVASVSVFQDQAGVEAVTRLAAGWLRENLASLMPNPPQVTMGEVVLGTAGQARRAGVE